MDRVEETIYRMFPEYSDEAIGDELGKPPLWVIRKRKQMGLKRKSGPSKPRRLNPSKPPIVLRVAADLWRDAEEANLSHIARKHGITREYVRQIKDFMFHLGIWETPKDARTTN